VLGWLYRQLSMPNRELCAAAVDRSRGAVSRISRDNGTVNFGGGRPPLGVRYRLYLFSWDLHFIRGLRE
ncbi:MAG: hypothetical protein WBY75_08225, partial [Terracidiphilus sp.]